MITKYKLFENIETTLNPTIIIYDRFIQGCQIEVFKIIDKNLFIFKNYTDLDDSSDLDIFLYDNNIDFNKTYTIDEIYDIIISGREKDSLNMVGFIHFYTIYKPRKYMIKNKQNKFNI